MTITVEKRIDIDEKHLASVAIDQLYDLLAESSDTVSDVWYDLTLRQQKELIITIFKEAIKEMEDRIQ